MEQPDIEMWYDQNQARYQDLIFTVERLLTTLLKEAGIPYHSVGGRLKTKESYLEKWDRKAYTSPEEVMDVAGLRVITHTTAEVRRVCKLVEEQFQIDQVNSGDKAQEMEVDEVGYLSVHYIARISGKRLELDEYKRFEGVCFEIQVRSLLQHAWAEIEHDRSYKFAGVLPKEIQRKFYLVAGTLELMDQEFTALSQEIDQYAQEVKEQVQDQAEKGQALDIPIDSTSLLQLLEETFKDYDLEKLSGAYSSGNSKLIAELSDFGLKTLQDVKALLDQKTPAQWMDRPTITYHAILRAAMMLNDPKQYFERAWNRHWGGFTTKASTYWEELGIDVEALSQYVHIKEDRPGHYRLEKPDAG